MNLTHIFLTKVLKIFFDFHRFSFLGFLITVLLYRPTLIFLYQCSMHRNWWRHKFGHVQNI